MVSWKYHKQSEIKINKIPYSKGHTHTHTHTHIHRGRPKLRWEDGAMEDARGEKLEECCKEKRQLPEASEEGLGSKGAVVPMMMMTMIQIHCECVFRQVQEKCSCIKHSYSSTCKKRLPVRNKKVRLQCIWPAFLIS